MPDDRAIQEWNKKLRQGIDELRLAMADLRAGTSPDVAMRKLIQAEKRFEQVEEQTSIAAMAF